MARAQTNKAASYALKIALGYLIVALIWVFISNRFLSIEIKDPHKLALFESIKGVAFVLVTAIALFAFVRGQIRLLVRKEEEAKKSERFLADIFNSFLDGISILDRDLNIIRVNPVMEKWYAAKMPLLGRKCHELFDEERGKGAKCPSTETLQTGKSAQTVVSAPGPNGLKRWVHLYAYPIIDSDKGETIGVLEYLKDITEQKGAEEALKESEEKYRTVFNSAADAIIITDNESTILEANRKAGELLGLAGGELAGRPEYSLYPAGEESRYRRLFRSAIQSGKSLSGDIYLVSRSGGLIPVEVTKSRAAFGGREVLITVFRDITDRKEAEDRITQQFEMLSSLYSGAQDLTEILDLKEISRRMAQSCVENFSAGFASICRAEPDGKLRVIAFYPEDDFGSLLDMRWDDSPAGEGPPGRAVKTGAPVIVPDLAGERSFLPWLESAEEKGLKTGAAFPLISRKKTFGALTIYSEEADFFTRERVRFFQAYTHQAAAAVENARLIEETGHRLDRLNALCRIDTAISASLDLRVTLNILLDQVITQLGVDAASVLLMDPNTLLFEYAAGRGFRTKGIEATRQRLGEGFAGRTAMERRVTHIQSLTEPADERGQLFEKEGFEVYFAAPLITKGVVKGVLELFHRAPLEPDREWLDFLEVMASQAAIAIENAALFNDLQRTNLELALAYDTTLEGWSRALDLRDRETEGHTLRVTRMTMELARALGMDEQALLHVRRGALLHDIGKMGIPDNVLLKPGPLSDEELRVMRRHPVYALELLMPIAYLRPALPIPYLHHERFDGSGYPQGLRGEQIPIAARIFSVVDVWDALSSGRPYRQAWRKEQVVEYLLAESGRQFDPRIVGKFLELWEEGAYSIGEGDGNGHE